MCLSSLPPEAAQNLIDGIKRFVHLICFFGSWNNKKLKSEIQLFQKKDDRIRKGHKWGDFRWQDSAMGVQISK